MVVYSFLDQFAGGWSFCFNLVLVIQSIWYQYAAWYSMNVPSNHRKNHHQISINRSPPSQDLKRIAQSSPKKGTCRKKSPSNQHQVNLRYLSLLDTIYIYIYIYIHISSPSMVILHHLYGDDIWWPEKHHIPIYHSLYIYILHLNTINQSCDRATIARCPSTTPLPRRWEIGRHSLHGDAENQSTKHLPLGTVI